MHAVPVNVDLLSELKHQFPYHVVEANLWFALKTQMRRGIPYLFFENRRGEQFIFDAPSVPSQFLRQLLARTLNVEERWDWALYLGEQEILSTLQKLSSWKPATP